MDNHLNENALKYFTKQEVPITKEKLRVLVENLPDEVMWEELIDRLVLLQKIEIGLHQVETGQTYTIEEAKERMKKWLK